jgi:hypothetical protein
MTHRLSQGAPGLERRSDPTANRCGRLLVRKYLLEQRELLDGPSGSSLRTCRRRLTCMSSKYSGLERRGIEDADDTLAVDDPLLATLMAATPVRTACCSRKISAPETRAASDPPPPESGHQAIPAGHGRPDGNGSDDVSFESVVRQGHDVIPALAGR